MFYKNDNAAVLVYDITSKESFEELTKYWSEQIKDSSPENIILAIAANKRYLADKEEIDEGTAGTLSDKLGANFISITATQVESINDLFIQIAKKYTGSENVEIRMKKKQKRKLKKIKKIQ